MTDTFNQQLAHFPAGTDDLAAKAKRVGALMKLSDVTVSIYRLRGLAGITLADKGTVLLDLAMVYEENDPDLAKRLRAFYYNEFHHPEPQDWLPTISEIERLQGAQK